MTRPAISLRQMGAGPSGKPGNDGWTPVLAVLEDGDRRVQQIVGWTGGQGDMPLVGWFVGPDGPVETIAEAMDIRGPQGLPGPAVTPGSISNDLLAEMPAGTILGNATGNPAVAQYLLPAETRALILPDGTVSNAMLADGAINEAKLAGGAVTNDKLATMLPRTVKGRAIGEEEGPPQDLDGAGLWAIAGPAGKATTEQALAATDDEAFMTALKNKEAMPASFAQAGWQKLPSGLIIQWGHVNPGAATNPKNGVFPIAFPNNVFGATAAIKSSISTVNYSLTILSMTNSGIACAVNYSLTGSNTVSVAGEGYYYFAWGN